MFDAYGKSILNEINHRLDCQNKEAVLGGEAYFRSIGYSFSEISISLLKLKFALWNSVFKWIDV